MSEAASVLLAIPLFAVTNIDDVFVLLGFFADRRFTAKQVVLGQYGGIALLIAVSLLAALLALVLPPQYIGLLGLAPLAIGIKKLWDLRQADDDEEETPHAAGASSIANITAVGAVTVANGGDNIGVYAPLFATRSASEMAVIVATFLAMTGLWCLAAMWLVNHRTLGAPLKKHGNRVLPFVLIALGLFILYEGGSHRLLATEA